MSLLVPAPFRSRTLYVEDAAGGTINVPYPATTVSGDRLVLVLGVDKSDTVTVADWTELDQTDNGTDTGGVWWKEADGTEGGTTFEVTRSAGGLSDVSAAIYSVPSSGTPEAAVATGSDVNPDPPSLSPAGGSAPYAWITAYLQVGGATNDWPDDIGGWSLVTPPTPGITLVVGTQASEQATLNPGTWTTNAGQPWTAWTVAVPVAAPAAGFPGTFSAAKSVWSPAASSQTLTLPADIAAGDLLVAEIATTGNTTPAITGWTTLLGPEYASAHETGAVLYKEADGTEGASVTVTLGSSASGAATCRRVTDADATKLDGAIQDASGDTVTPPSLTPADGSDKILWITGYTGDSTAAAPEPGSQWPFDFSISPAWIRVDSGIYSGCYGLEAASVTPTVVDISAVRRNVSWTVAIYPAAVSTPEASGTVTAEASLSATGHVTPKASGQVAAVASLSATGFTPVPGSDAFGTVAAVATITAVGHVAPKAAGQVAAVGTLTAVGHRTMEAAGQVTAIGSLTAVGQIPVPPTTARRREMSLSASSRTVSLSASRKEMKIE